MRTVTRTATAGVFVAALLLAGCGSDSEGSSSSTTAAEKTTTTAAAAATELELTDVWARQSPMGTTMGAIYLTITSPEDDKLVKASVPASVAADAQIHETVMAEGDMTSTTMAGKGDMTSTTMAGEGDMSSTTMAADSGSMTMRPVDAIELPAGTMVELKPGGFHIMLIDLAAPLKVGDKVELTLTFEKAGDRTVTAEVREG